MISFHTNNRVICSTRTDGAIWLDIPKNAFAGRRGRKNIYTRLNSKGPSLVTHRPDEPFFITFYLSDLLLTKQTFYYYIICVYFVDIFLQCRYLPQHIELDIVIFRFSTKI